MVICEDVAMLVVLDIQGMSWIRSGLNGKVSEKYNRRNKKLFMA